MLIQRRLTLGIGALFAMILLLGIQSVGYILDLSRASGNILTDNYNSLHYARSMMTALDSLTFDSTSMTELLDNLALQRRNITESDEFRVTDNLSSKIDKLSDSVTLDKILEIRSDLYKIMDLNMTAIREKSRLAGTTAEDAMLRIAVSAILCALIAFVLLIRFPQAVVRPIRELKKGIMEIANFHYDKRLDFSRNKEFRAVAESFNNMAEKLSEYQRSTLDDLMMAKKRIEAVVNSLHEPIIGLDPDKKILFMNDEAFTILNLKPEEAVGRNATEVALNNDLLRRLIRELYSDDPNKEPLKIYADNKESYFQMENIPLYVTPVGEKKKSFIGNMIILNNITKYKEIDSAKTNFISTVSHEMKTPIASIMMSLHLLEDSRLGPLNDEQKALAQSIRENSDRLLGITGELLNLTQIETGQAATDAEGHQTDRTDRLRGGGDASAGRTFRLFRRSRIPRKDREAVHRQRKNRLGGHEPARRTRSTTRPKGRGSSSARRSATTRSIFSCRTSDAASTRATTRASSTVTSACRARKCRAAASDWLSRKSSSRRTAARSASRARSGTAAGSRSRCPSDRRGKATAGRAND